VRLKLKEQGAQMAVGSSGVDCGVWTKQFVGRPEGNSGTNKKNIAGWFWGFLVCPSVEKEKTFLRATLTDLVKLDAKL
jgi:hypothetical protein